MRFLIGRKSHVDEQLWRLSSPVHPRLIYTPYCYSCRGLHSASHRMKLRLVMELRLTHCAVDLRLFQCNLCKVYIGTERGRETYKQTGKETYRDRNTHTQTYINTHAYAQTRTHSHTQS